MTIETFRLGHLRVDEHFQFNTEFCDLVTRVNPATLKIEPQFNAYLALYAREDEALKKITKSAITDDIQQADHVRDVTFSGMTGANRAALKHFRPEKVTAAKRLQVLFDTYGNIARKPLNEQTSAIYNLLQELKGAYAADVAAAGIDDWVQELEANNGAFDLLVKSRYDESAQRTNLVLKEERLRVDDAYRTIVERINALMLIEGGEAYENFIRQFNVVIEKYKNAIARRQGKAKPANIQTTETTP